MLERVVENWLDSASERSYQVPFCQILVAQGHRVLHSTRHSAIELGKDVISQDPEGHYCAYQLKGDPGGRMTVNSYREIEPQLRELVTLAIDTIEYEPGTWHRSYLVTNGFIDEEVRLLIERLNKGFSAQGLMGRLEFIERGKFLADAIALGPSLWPSEYSFNRTLLEFLTRDGSESFDLAAFESLMTPILGLGDVSERRISRAEFKRRVASAALLTHIATSAFSARRNDWALIQAWCIFVVLTHCSLDKNEIPPGEVRRTLALARDQVRVHLDNLAQEAVQVQSLLLPNSVFDSYFYRARELLVCSLVATLKLWVRLEPDSNSFVCLSDNLAFQFVSNADISSTHIWGEGAIPSFLACYWYLKASSPASEAERRLVDVLRTIVGRKLVPGRSLASPYYNTQDVVRSVLSKELPHLAGALEEETGLGRSYFAQALFRLLVRTNRKRECKTLWAQYSRTTLVEFRPAARWRFGFWRDAAGKYVNTTLPEAGCWPDLIAEAVAPDSPNIPPSLLNEPAIVLLYTIVAPHRASPELIRWLSLRLERSWFNCNASS